MAVQGLHDDGAVLGAERLDLRLVAGDQGRRHELREIEDEQLLGRVAHLGRVVHHQGPRMDPLQHMGRGDVGHVERRILAHEHHVDIGQIDTLHGTEGRVSALHILDPEGLDPRGHHLPLHGEAVRRVEQKVVASRLRFEEQGEGGVTGDPDRLDRVHLNRDGQSHGARASFTFEHRRRLGDPPVPSLRRTQQA